MKKWLIATALLAALMLAGAALAEEREVPTVFFGAYEQDGNADNGAEPIEWLVMEESGDTLTLLSRCALDAKAYDDESLWEYDTNWDKSLRAWLNGEFLESAFSGEERQRVETVAHKIITFQLEDNITYADVEDTVWIPGWSDLEAWFPDEAERQCQPTAYAVSRGAWMQDEGAYAGNCLYAMMDGIGWYTMSVIDCRGEEVETAFASDYLGVRPVIQARLPEAEYPRGTAALPTAAKPEESAEGTVVQFGWYEQGGVSSGPNGFWDDDSMDEGEPIEWEVLEERDGVLLLRSRHALRQMRYDETSKGTAWEDCTLRQWLNTTFLEAAFPAEEQALLVERDGDRVSLLTREEFLRAVGRGWNCTTYGTELAMFQDFYDGVNAPGIHIWLLRDGEGVAFGAIYGNTLGGGICPVIAVRATVEELAALAETIGERADKSLLCRPTWLKYPLDDHGRLYAVYAGPGEDYPMLCEWGGDCYEIYASYLGSRYVTDESSSSIWSFVEFNDGEALRRGYIQRDPDEEGGYLDIHTYSNSAATCAAGTTVYAAPSLTASEDAVFPEAVDVTLLEYDGDYAFIEYADAAGARRRGYVRLSAIAVSQ